MKKIDKVKIVKSALVKKNRIQATFTLDEDVYKKFQNECEKLHAPMSRVLEAFMVDFIKGE